MLTGKTLENFSKLILKYGVNLQKNQGLEIACPVEKQEIARAITRSAYQMGAKMVRVRWQDENIDLLSYQFADVDTLKEVPKWFIDSKNYLVENDYCYIAISAEDPDIFKDIPDQKTSAVAVAKSKALKKFSDVVMANGIRWCVVSVPTESWAKKVFPNAENPVEKLSDAIEKTMRLDCSDPEKEWQEHIEKLDKRAKYLNDMNFEYLHFKNSLGTDLKIGLADDHVWTSAQEVAKDGVKFVANMPTEEVFTAPHRLKAEGRLVSALPLVENGKVIENFTLDFKRGKVVGFSAEKGYETLKNLLNTDNGTLRLGEVALIGKNSPIAKSGILFFNTLFDENASCHLAIGKAYPTTIKNGNDLTLSQLKQKGLNDSTEHVDFMIGTPDLVVTGIGKDGTQTTIFSDGEWVI